MGPGLAAGKLSIRSFRTSASSHFFPFIRHQPGVPAIPCSTYSHSIVPGGFDAFRTQKLPDRMTLVCGVVETTHNYVEHPLVIAERLERAVPVRTMATSHVPDRLHGIRSTTRRSARRAGRDALGRGRPCVSRCISTKGPPKVEEYVPTILRAS